MGGMKSLGESSLASQTPSSIKRLFRDLLGYRQTI